MWLTWWAVMVHVYEDYSSHWFSDTSSHRMSYSLSIWWWPYSIYFSLLRSPNSGMTIRTVSKYSGLTANFIRLVLPWLRTKQILSTVGLITPLPMVTAVSVPLFYLSSLHIEIWLKGLFGPKFLTLNLLMMLIGTDMENTRPRTDSLLGHFWIQNYKIPVKMGLTSTNNKRAVRKKHVFIVHRRPNTVISPRAMGKLSTLPITDDRRDM